MNYIFNGKYNSSFMMQERMSFIKMISVYVFGTEDKRMNFIKRISYLFFEIENKRMNI